MLKGLKKLWRSWADARKGRRLRHEIDAGRVHRGRQVNKGGDLDAAARFRGSISARIYREGAGTWEDLGIISSLTGKE